MPPAHYEEAVARAVQRIRGRRAREGRAGPRGRGARARRRTIPAAVLGLLREAFPSWFVFAVGRGDATFIGATPGAAGPPRGPAGQHRRAGRLDPAQRRSGGRRSPRRAAAAQRQGPRGERDRRPPDRPRAAAARRVGDRRAGAGGGPGGQHPASGARRSAPSWPSPIDARRAGRRCCTRRRPSAPSRPSALALIPALEGLDRGWYAGPVGWTDAAGDGEFCVALRCALLRGRVARCYAGCGIVARLRPGGRAGRDRGQAPGDAAGARRLSPSARAAAPGVGHPAVQRQVRPAVGADLDDRGPGPRRARLDGVAGARPASRPLVAAAVERGRVREVEAVRGGDVLLEGVGLAGHRQEVEDPAAVVVEQHDRQVEVRGGARRAGRRCRGRARRRRSAAPPARRRRRRRRTRWRRCRRSRWRRGWTSTRGSASPAGRYSSTSRIGIEEATNSVASGPSHSPRRARHQRLGQLARRARRRSPPRRASSASRQRASQAGSRRRGRASRRSSAATGSPVDARSAPRPGPARRRSGSSATCSTSSSAASQVAQRLGGRQIADPDDQLGRDALRRSRRRAAAGRRWRSPPGRGGRRTAGRRAAG